MGDLTPPVDDNSQGAHETAFDDQAGATDSGSDPGDAVADYMQFADTTHQTGTSDAADKSPPSPLDDYLVAAGVDPANVQPVEHVMPPDPALDDAPDAQSENVLPDDNLDAGMDAGADTVDPTLPEDPQHHGI